MFSSAFFNPSKICALVSASFKLNFVLLIIISLLNKRNSFKTSLMGITLGTPFTIASIIIIPKVS
jgi:hypothetical protein